MTIHITKDTHYARSNCRSNIVLSVLPCTNFYSKTKAQCGSSVVELHKGQKLGHIDPFFMRGPSAICCDTRYLI